MADVIILGNGPAGISAAAYTARANLNTVVIGRDGGSLEKAEKIENYYGFAQPISGKQLVLNGIEQAKRLGVEVISDEVVSIEYGTEGFVVRTKSTEHKSGSIILATGSARKAPKIQGLADFEGKGVSYCAVCDAFFYKGKDVAVLGDGEYALHEAMELLAIASTVTLLTNGKELTAQIPPEIMIINKEISAFEGDGVLNAVRFTNDETKSISGVFIALGVAGSSDLARKLGAEINGTTVVVDEEMQTTVPGLFSAGDCTGGMLQVAKAVYDGAKAGMSAIKYSRNHKG